MSALLLASASAMTVLTISTMPPADSFLMKLAKGATAVSIGRRRVLTSSKKSGLECDNRVLPDVLTVR